ncbi:hypothetical protein CAOG_009941 [Capsaspora owczarzaki ATCC 30864]|uniref:Uncharacterized protein n=1 Tax=Capsaspora owczarzaki (strain ATCC 30864) TaxID=595528 RepID=A0A0D2VVT9_CAPO3|nr:hypothetical protein CAOG_009941 [Capsaspora owczarzaki ATCC 30864]
MQSIPSSPLNVVRPLVRLPAPTQRSAKLRMLQKTKHSTFGNKRSCNNAIRNGQNEADNMPAPICVGLVVTFPAIPSPNSASLASQSNAHVPFLADVCQRIVSVYRD